MAYTNPMKIANGLALDFAVETGGGSDAFLMKAADGTVTQTTSVPASRISSAGNLTEVTSSVLTITGGTGALLSNVSILVKQAGASQAGYLSSTDWNTFNNKLSSSLANGYVLIGDGTAQAVNTGSLGDIGATVGGGLAIKSSVISNTHILSNAAITRTKLANGTAYRILANNIAGVMSENAPLTASRIVLSDGNGQLTSSSANTTHATFISTLTDYAQLQMDTKITGRATNALVQTPTSGQDGYAIIWDDGNQEWALGDPVVQGIPVAGSTNQVLMKNSGTNYDASWTSLLLSHVTNVTSSFDDVNVLLGANASGVTPSIIGYLGGGTPLTSSVQQQLNSRLSNSLSPGAIYYGSGAGVATQLSSATDGWVLTMVSGFPQWQVVVGTGTVTSVDVSGGTTGLTFSGGPVSTTGTITMSGTLDANNGGTGFSSYTIGDLLYANATSTLAKLGIGSDGEVLTLAGGVPTWAAGGGSVADADYGDVVVTSTGSVWTVKASLNKAWTGTHSFIDNAWTLLDNVDATKILAFQLSGISAGNTRTLSVPDLSGTIALIGGSGNGAALTKTDDTNVTLSLGGGPSTALLTAASLTLGWSGQLAVTRGGTGLSSTTQGDILYADASNSLVTLPKSASATRYLSNTGSSNNPAWAQIDLTSGVSGALPIASGGTNLSSYTTGDLIQATATNVLGKLNSVATGNVLISGGVGTASSWGKVTSGHVDATIQVAGLSWLAASGVAMTANNTVSGAFNIGFTNTAFGIGVAPGSIAANTTLDVRGSGGGTNLIQRWADGATLRVSIKNNGQLWVESQADDVEGLVYGTAGTRRISMLVNQTTATTYIQGYGNSGVEWKVGTLAAGQFGFLVNNNNGGFLLRNSTSDTNLTAVLSLFTGSVSNSIAPGNSTKRAVLTSSVNFLPASGGNADMSVFEYNGNWTSGFVAFTTATMRGIWMAPTISQTNGTGTFIGFDYSPPSVTVLGTHLAWRNTSGNMLIGGTTLTAGSVLVDMQSTTRALVLTRVTNIGSVATPVNGMLTYDAATDLFNFRQAGAWSVLGDVTLTGSQTLTNKTLGSGTVFSAIPTINAGITFTFSPTSTLSGLNVGSYAGIPSGLNNGDIWYNTSSAFFNVRVNGNTDTVVTCNDSQLLINKTLGSGTSFTDGVRMTFNPNGTNSGLNVGGHTADPSSPVNGDIYYDSTNNVLKAYINGGWKTVTAV